jgi:protoporphyrinogen oxidase
MALKVIVVGAGIAGLAAAWELMQAGRDVTILESERRPGGVILTEPVDGFLVEGGPDGFLAGEPELPALAQEAGIGNRVIEQQARGTALWSGGKLQPIDAGQAAVLLGIEAKPSEVEAGFRSFASGMGELITALSQRLSGSLRLAQGVAGLAREGTRWRLAITGGSAHNALKASCWRCRRSRRVACWRVWE